MKKEEINNLKRLVEKLLKLYDSEIKSGLEERYKEKTITDCDELIFSLHSKSTKTIRAILHLVDEGYIEDGFVLLRSLLENLINTSFILRDKQVYCRMFIDFGFYDWYRKLEGLLKDNDHSFFSKKAEKILEQADTERYKTIKKCRSLIKGNDYIWSKKKIKEMAELCNLKNSYYDKVYFYLSQYTHPHQSGLSTYSSNSRKTVIFDDSPHLKGAEELLITTTDIYIKLLKLTVDFAGVKTFNKNIQAIEKELESLLKQNNQP